LKLKEIKLFSFGSVLVAIVLFGSLELTTRLISWFTGKGFCISLHEYEPYDRHITHLYKWHPFTGLTFQPGISFKAGHPNQANQVPIITDHYGFLSDGQTLTYEKSANEIRIATIGASTTANINLAYSQNWPGYLGNLVQKALPNKKIRIINAGVPGFDTAQSIGNLALRVMPLKPDIVIIYHSYNDLKAINQGAVFRPDYSHIHQRPFGSYTKPNIFFRCLNYSMFFVRSHNKYRAYKRDKSIVKKMNNLKSGETRLSFIPKKAEDTFEQHIRSLISIAESGGAQVILSSFATLHNTKSSFKEIRQSRRSSELKKTELFLIGYFIPGLTVDATFKGIMRYNVILRQVAHERHTGWVDNASLIPHEDKYFVDRVHFSHDGAALMARNLFPVVLHELEKL